MIEGRSRKGAAHAAMDRQTLRDRVHRYNEAGLAGLLSRTAPGPPPKLSQAQMDELRKIVVDGPDPEKHDVVRWRCIDLCGEIKRRFEVAVDESTVGKWLRKLGLTRLQPRPFHPKKDASAQEAFRKTLALC